MPRKSKEKPKKRASRGQPPWEPTSEQRAQVSALAQHLVPQDVIADFVGVDKLTLRKHCAAELKTRAKGLSKLTQAAFQMATVEPSMMKFFLQVMPELGYSTTARDAEAADRRRFAHEKEMARLNAELRREIPETIEILPPIIEFVDREEDPALN